MWGPVSQVSFAVIKCHSKISWGIRVYFSLWFHIQSTTKDGQGRDPESGTEAVAVVEHASYWLSLQGLLSLLSYTSQVSRNGITDSGLGPPTSVFDGKKK